MFSGFFCSCGNECLDPSTFGTFPMTFKFRAVIINSDTFCNINFRLNKSNTFDIFVHNEMNGVERYFTLCKQNTISRISKKTNVR